MLRKCIFLAVVLALIFGSFSCGPGPEVSPTPMPQETTPTLTPSEQNFIGLSVDEMYEKLFHSNLAYPQQEELWKNYKGKQVEWTGTLKNHGFNLSEIMERSDIEFQEIIISKDGVIISYLTMTEPSG